MGDRHADWNYEALGGAVGLGLDSNHAHVQPGGIYHYRIPIGCSKNSILWQARMTTTHSTHCWAADGFPVYYAYGYQQADDPTSDIVNSQQVFN